MCYAEHFSKEHRGPLTSADEIHLYYSEWEVLALINGSFLSKSKSFGVLWNLVLNLDSQSTWMTCNTQSNTHLGWLHLVAWERAADVRRLDLEFDAKEKLFLFKTRLGQTIRYKGFLCSTKVLVTLFEMKVSEKSGTKKSCYHQHLIFHLNSVPSKHAYNT